MSVDILDDKLIEPFESDILFVPVNDDVEELVVQVSSGLSLIVLLFPAIKDMLFCLLFDKFVIASLTPDMFVVKFSILFVGILSLGESILVFIYKLSKIPL